MKANTSLLLKCFVLPLLLLSGACSAQLKLAGIFTDNMVLQQKKQNNVWGYTSPGDRVTVQFGGKKYASVANEMGEWNVKITPTGAGNAGLLEVLAGKEIIQLKNILVGEVWLCGGQSNMDLTMQFFKAAYPAEILGAVNDNIRFAVIAKKFDSKENKEVRLSKGWSAVTPTSVLDCSATGYFYAKKLYEKLKVPIGLVNVAWGGTPAQAWVDGASLDGFDEYKKLYNEQIKTIDFDKLEADRKKIQKEYSIKKRESAEQFKVFLKPGIKSGDWKKTRVPGNWEAAGFPNFDGIAAYQIKFELAADAVTQQATLHLPGIDDIDSTYINGKFIGSKKNWDVLRTYSIPASILKAGENIITVWIEDTGGGGGFADDNENFYVELGGQKIPLKGDAEFMMLANAVPATGDIPYANLKNQPAVLFNGMIAPLLPYSFAGAIWYQGEANAAKFEEYRKLFPTVINNWRQRFSQGDFPFYFVQLSAFNPTRKEPEISNWAFLREAQTMTLQLPNTGMVATYDIGNETDIHPTKKKEVGDRLAAIALQKNYGYSSMVAEGPIFKTAIVSETQVRIQFLTSGKDLKQPATALQGFTIAGQDKVFVPATATIKNNEVIVSGVANPRYVRYAWANAPMTANLYNAEGFPAVPFRTDE